MKWLLLTLLITANAQASHECREYAKDKATRLVELYFCDSYLDSCTVKMDEIITDEFTELQSYPSMDVYSFSVPMVVAYSGEEEAVSIPVHVMAGLAGIGSEDCMLYELELIEEDYESER